MKTPKAFLCLGIAAGFAAAVTGCCQPTANQSQTATCTDSVQCQYANKCASDIVIENIMSRRSIRKYKPQPVGRDTMQTIIKCGINAPNGQNKQSWEVRVVDDAKFINAVTELFVKANPKAAEDPSFKNMFRNAPTVAFIANDPSYGCSQIDCGLLGQNMMLAANAMGIGSCCLGGPVGFLKSAEAAQYLQQLGFSEGYELLYCIAFGYPDETPAAKPRDESKARFVDFQND